MLFLIQTRLVNRENEYFLLINFDLKNSWMKIFIQLWFLVLINEWKNLSRLFLVVLLSKLLRVLAIDKAMIRLVKRTTYKDYADMSFQSMNYFGTRIDFAEFSIATIKKSCQTFSNKVLDNIHPTHLLKYVSSYLRFVQNWLILPI